ncbi:MAG TPA: hypothetical protein DEQ68_01755 [Ruminococcaceae bacterium]|nr:hypothetical protein [Oscillospiraceae bacterium]
MKMSKKINKNVCVKLLKSYTHRLALGFGRTNMCKKTKNALEIKAKMCYYYRDIIINILCVWERRRKCQKDRT